jgi:DNA-directed RNA polymerase subunit beta
MQSLALDVNVVSEEGTRAEMRDEDDDLLRAAEELGIDLSGVRAADVGAGGAVADAEPDAEVEEPDVEEPEVEAPDPVDLADDIIAPDLDDEVLVDPDLDIEIDAEAPAET